MKNIDWANIRQAHGGKIALALIGFVAAASFGWDLGAAVYRVWGHQIQRMLG